MSHFTHWRDAKPHHFFQYLWTFGNRVVLVAEAPSTAHGVPTYLGTPKDYPTRHGQLLVITRPAFVQSVGVVGFGGPYKSIFWSVWGCNFGFNFLNIIDELIKSPHFESGTFPKKGQSMPRKGDRKARYTNFYQCQSLFLILDGSEAMPGYATYINDQENQAANRNKHYDRVGKFACQYINPHK